jgi:hypothetical protein
MLRTTYLIGLASLFGAGTVLVVASVEYAAVLLAWGLFVGVCSLGIVRLVFTHGEVPMTDVAPMIVAAGGLWAGWTVALLVGSAPLAWVPGIAVLVGVGAAWLGDALSSGPRARVCFVCKQRAEPPVFGCPRCHQAICSRPSCWIARHFRCKLCDEREVVLFPPAAQWWEHRFGSRIATGTCADCLKEAGEADLRACRQCRWTYCRRCWDLHNGQCAHCEWVAPDLPKALLPFFRTAHQPDPRARSGAPGRSPGRMP